MQSWQLPELLVVPVRRMFDASADGANGTADADTEAHQIDELGRIMSLARHVVAVTCDRAKPGSLADYYERIACHFHLDQDKADEFLLELEPAIIEAAATLEIELPKGSSHREILDQARLQVVDISLSTSVQLQAAERRVESLEVRNRELNDKAHTDKLTGLPNRAAFDAALDREVELRMIGNEPGALGLLLLDLDKFKSLNDTLGHQAGDEVLREVGKVLASVTRQTDLCARYGGEEFALIVPATTPLRLQTMADRVRAAVAEKHISWEGQHLQVTVSVGGACLASVANREDGAQLIKIADEHLYRAKDNGRNCSEVASRPMSRGSD